MLKVQILCFGKLRAPGLADAFAYYTKLLGAWVDLEVIELKATEIRSRDDGERKRVQAADAELFEKALGKGGAKPHLVLLDEIGRAESTEKWAERVPRWEGASHSRVIFGIGGAVGFSAELRARAAEKLSLGPQTLSHELARVVLAEQLYRAWSVTRGHPYHIGG